METAPVFAEIDRSRLLAFLIRQTGDLALAEDALQDAIVSALEHWGRRGQPSNPAAWLLQVARRKAIDRLRRNSNWQRKEAEIERLVALDAEASEEIQGPIPDERLALIFTCCHPALDRNASVALALRTLCGLTTEEIARAFVVPRETMAQRLVRVQQKIAKAGIPFSVPSAEAMPERLAAVLAVIYLIFTVGYTSSAEAYLRLDLCKEALRLCAMLHDLLPDEAEPLGLLALMQLHHARSPARLDGNGIPVALEDQNRDIWDHAAIKTAIAQLEEVLTRRRPGPYQLQAAIAALHCEAKRFLETDWQQIIHLYDRLLEHNPNPAFALNRLVALSYLEGATVLPAMAELEDQLRHYQPFHAAMADLLWRSGQVDAATAAFARAIALSDSEAQRLFLARRQETLKAAAKGATHHSV